MKNLFIFPFFAILFFLGSCNKDMGLQQVANNFSTKDSILAMKIGTMSFLPYSPTRVLISSNTVNSSSGITDNGGVFYPSVKMEVNIWGDYVDGHINSATTNVDSDYILVGGGARVSDLSNNSSNVNALLTAAYPVNDNSFYFYNAASKDHIQFYNHRLWVYAIGIKFYLYSLKSHAYYPIDRNVLLPYFSINTTSTPVAQHPHGISYAPSGYSVLSGGALLTWQNPSGGNMLVENGISDGGAPIHFTESTGKDHITATPAVLQTFTLSVNNNLIYIGPLDIQQKITSTFNVQHLQTLTQSTDPGYLLAGIGAYTTYSGSGRMLYAMYPLNGQTTFIGGKDHVWSDISGGLVSEIYEIKLP
ncbi:MAG: hypothetical protein EO766_15075 [Hydrotalea sp. AMD]|uniref:hypothetical protein n=1 Tax=Hydrotalea sp. AMD TaxID=2501297 RepID=UPI000941ED82|nr:hypothetical protein [Hydrotalea sp. AMD]RWZ86151.1 MAG: hypothetical protein EO766_15075 [Hydrotalea sp. AMD]